MVASLVMTFPKVEKPLYERILERFGDGLRDLVAAISVHLDDLAKTEQQRRHDGETTECLTQTCSGVKVHTMPSRCVHRCV